TEALTDEEKALLLELPKYEEKFHEAMQDDFNTADAISFIFELVKFGNTYAKEGASQTFVTAVYDEIIKLCDILGLIYQGADAAEHALTDEEIEDYIRRRTEAKKARDFQEADRIREELKDKGVLIEDTREGVRFKRV
ncbi:MAG: DALR domain-containing protein, partial [Cellulosilyticaceae bacterium]